MITSLPHKVNRKEFLNYKKRAFVKTALISSIFSTSGRKIVWQIQERKLRSAIAKSSAPIRYLQHKI